MAKPEHGCNSDLTSPPGRSSYLKQLAQEALRDLTPRIQNDIDVVCCSGLSSVGGGGAHN
ncbi:MAG: hypothetical protein FJ276_22895 [Planctomycetes bacterium]|nr:hypothetical protein [Planctomycetota bacterium]